MTTSPRRVLTAVLLLGALTLGTAACGDDATTNGTNGSTAQPSAQASVDAASLTAIIDVRTAEEFAQGHLEGAVNLDVTAPDFDAQVAELEASGTYVVYCRSGSRSGQAIDRMTELGFTDLTNGGGVEQAAQMTDLEIVTTP